MKAAFATCTVPSLLVGLKPDQLLKLSNAEDSAGVDDLELQRCIECGLCNRVCPSAFNLSVRFSEAKRIASELTATEAEKQRIKTRYQLSLIHISEPTRRP